MGEALLQQLSLVRVFFRERRGYVTRAPFIQFDVMLRHYRAARDIAVLFWPVPVVNRVLPPYTDVKGTFFYFKCLDIVGKTSQTRTGDVYHVTAVVTLQDRVGHQ